MTSATSASTWKSVAGALAAALLSGAATFLVMDVRQGARLEKIEDAVHNLEMAVARQTLVLTAHGIIPENLVPRRQDHEASN